MLKIMIYQTHPSFKLMIMKFKTHKIHYGNLYPKRILMILNLLLHLQDFKIFNYLKRMKKNQKVIMKMKRKSYLYLMRKYQLRRMKKQH